MKFVCMHVAVWIALFRTSEQHVLPNAETNLALHKPVKASSKYEHIPAVAVDGGSGTYWDSKSCFHTDVNDRYPWWQVDLQEVYQVQKLDVITRSDCCPERFRDVAVEVFDSDPSITPGSKPEVCYMYSAMISNPGQTVTMTCRETVKGRFVRLSGKTENGFNKMLQFCEVKVFGITMEEAVTTTNLTVQKPANSCSTYIEEKPVNVTVENPDNSSATYNGGESTNMTVENLDNSSPTISGGESTNVTVEKSNTSSPTYNGGESTNMTVENPDNSSPTYNGGESTSVTVENPDNSSPTYNGGPTPENVTVEKPCPTFVEGILTDLALQKPVNSSSSYHGANPSAAVDDSDALHWESGSCFAVSNDDPIPWWEVDLQDTFNVIEVAITVRGDCCPERFHDVKVEVYKDDPSRKSQVCNTYKGPATITGETITLKCPECVTGRFVRLTGMAKKDIAFGDVLQFCQVRVFGTSY